MVFKGCLKGVCSLKEVSRMFQGSFKVITESFKGVSRKFKWCFKEFSRVFQKGISRNFQGV